ncbi:MAG: CAP domain-containing protein, partial [Thermoleophilia bacterium]|nr:CAP domain-containing protein [Thermoleophilia bacterium]
MRTARRSISVFLLVLVLLVTVIGGIAHARTYDADETRFLQLINDYRVQHGLDALMLSGIVSEAAARHSLDMGAHGFFSHTSERSSYFPAGSSPWDRMKLMGYPSGAAMAENIAAGQRTAQEVFDGWRNSPGHNKNMLSSAYRVIGVARRVVAGSHYGVYWTTDFGSVVDSSAQTPVAASQVGPSAASELSAEAASSARTAWTPGESSARVPARARLPRIVVASRKGRIGASVVSSGPPHSSTFRRLALNAA